MAKPAKKPAAPKRRPSLAKVAAKGRRAAPATKAAAKPAARATAKAPAKRRQTAVARRQPETLRLLELSVGMTVDDLGRSMRFYVDGLGFTVKERWERDGALRGVMLIAGSCEIALGQDDWAKGRGRAKGVAIRLYAETGQDIDALARRIGRAGIAVDGPKTASWGARMLSVTDPDGFQITFHGRVS
jgi:catechol 2,3-dioxygenase-like lactoylglutathione lyase family enzyme